MEQNKTEVVCKLVSQLCIHVAWPQHCGKHMLKNTNCKIAYHLSVKNMDNPNSIILYHK